MSKENAMFGIIGLLLGVVLAGFIAGQAVNNNNAGMMRIMGVDSDKRLAGDHSTMSMADMNEQLEPLSGDEFDKAFIEMMIAHHEGAVDMAELVPSRAKHDEVKQLGEAIIVAQTTEIYDMNKWQQDWGYSSDEIMQNMHEGH
ncbi:MAG: DUF305 domain-containing protein [bacterium]|nr:DUF305 domain-containing protein [bacterium]